MHAVRRERHAVNRTLSGLGFDGKTKVVSLLIQVPTRTR